jgi:hypothetical protein
MFLPACVCVRVHAVYKHLLLSHLFFLTILHHFLFSKNHQRTCWCVCAPKRHSRMLCSFLPCPSLSSNFTVEVIMNSAEFDSKSVTWTQHVPCSLCICKRREINIATSHYFFFPKTRTWLFSWVRAPKPQELLLHVFPVFLPPLLQNSAWRGVQCNSKNTSTSRHVPPSRFLCKGGYINSYFPPLYFIHHNISR